MAKKEMELVKGLFLFISLLSSMFMSVLCSRELNPGLSSFHQYDSAPTVVKGLDVKRYMGRWYQIAAFPTPFQDNNGKDTRATYSLETNGTVDVLNESWVNGKRNFVKGIAYKADPSSDEAKFRLKFLVPIVTPTSDYWVLYIDADYQNAIIGGPTRQFLWILARKSHIDDTIYNQLVQKAAAEGYDVSKLIKTPHSDTPPQ